MSRPTQDTDTIKQHFVYGTITPNVKLSILFYYAI